MKTGDRVNWRSSKDAFLVPGVVVKLGPKRVQIEVRELSRFGRDLVPRLKWVDARDLSRRIYPASVLREAMDMHDRGFAISVIKRLARTQVFPNGVFYGAIDGREATAPYGSADAASSPSTTAPGAALSSASVSSSSASRSAIVTRSPGCFSLTWPSASARWRRMPWSTCCSRCRASSPPTRSCPNSTSTR